MTHHIRKSLGWHYFNDAQEFLKRYSLLPAEEFSKSGRVKNFVDVLLAAECALKAHICVGRSEVPPLELYKELRRLSHNIRKLAARADFLEDRSLYDEVGERLGELSVDLRYSLDMWETFFPTFGPDDQTRRYDETVASTGWREGAVREVSRLLTSMSDAVTGEIAGEDFSDFFARELEMAEFVQQARIG